MKAVRIALVAAVAVVLAGPPAWAATPFELEWTKSQAQQEGGTVAGAPGSVALAPPSDVTAETDHFYVYINGWNDTGGAAPDCSNDPTPPKGACFSLSVWLERTVDELLHDWTFQDRLQTIIDELLDDPLTPHYDPLMDESLAIPLVGDFNLGFYIQDLWNTGVGPTALYDGITQIGTKYGDADDKAINVQDLLRNGTYSITVEPTGAWDGDAPIAGSYEGSIRLIIDFSTALDADVIFRQPDYPINVTTGYYLHGAGKIQLESLRVEAEIFSVGGNIRNNPPTSGYSVGVDLLRFYLSGGVHLDMDGYHCNEFTHSDTRVYKTKAEPNGRPVCDSSDLDPGHEYAGEDENDFTESNQYIYQTNTRNELLSEFIKYLEADLVYEAVRSSDAGVAQYLTAMEALDLQTLTHVTEPTIQKPSLEHPLNTGEFIYLDYGLWWTFNGENAAANGNMGVNLAGGFGADATYTGASECLELGVNEVPGIEDTRVASHEVGVPSLYFSRTENSRDAMVGAAVHKNPILRVMDRAWSKQLLCSQLDKNNALLGDALGDLFTTDTFSMFLPALDPAEDGKDMMMRVVPRYYAPNQVPADFDPSNDQPMVEYNPADPPACPDPITPGDRPCLDADHVWAAGYESYHGPFDMRMQVPHLEVQFFVDTDGSGTYPANSRIFSMETTAEIYAGVGWYKINAGYMIPDLVGDATCDASPYPCRVARLNMLADVQVSYVHDYNVDTYFEPDGLESSISSILGALLNSKIEANLELVLNTTSSDFLGITVDPGFETGNEPVYNVDPEYWGQAIEAVDVDAGIPGEEYLGLYLAIGDIYGAYDNQTGSPSATPDGYADALSPAFLTDLMEELGVLPAAPGVVREPTALTRNELGMVDPHASPDTYWDLGEHGFGAEVDLTHEQVRTLELGNGRIFLGADVLTDPSTDAQNVRYQYRIDNGPYSMISGRAIPVPALFDGHHTVSVAAVDREGYIDPTPAVLRFTLDRQGPRIRWVGDTRLLGQGGQVSLGVQVKDLVSSPEQIAVEWRIDDGTWQSVASDGVITDRVGGGAHVLEVRATDHNGNETTRDLSFVATDAGFGCQSGTAGGGALDLLVWLLPLSALWLRRKAAARA